MTLSDAIRDGALGSLAKHFDNKAMEWAKANPLAVERAKRRNDLKRRMKKKLKAAQRLMREIAELDAEPLPAEPGFSTPGTKIGDTITVQRPKRWTGEGKDGKSE